MSVEIELGKWLNLLKGANQFVLKDTSDGGAQVVNLPKVPESDGFYWVHGRTRLNSGQEVESVFHVDTDSGGELSAVYWFVDGKWYGSDDSEARELLGGSRSVFPFDWEFSVPLEYDAHHS